MAAKRISQSAINWAQLAERVPQHQKATYVAFKSRHDSYVRRVLANPETPPKIDWAFYKNKVPIVNMVDEFQRQYESLSIPYPSNPLTAQLDTLDQEIKKDIANFKDESNKRIEGYKKELAALNALLPFDQMTMEDFRDAYPDIALDSIKRPTFWPHTAEEIEEQKVDTSKHYL